MKYETSLLHTFRNTSRMAVNKRISCLLPISFSHFDKDKTNFCSSAILYCLIFLCWLAQLPIRDNYPRPSLWPAGVRGSLKLFFLMCLSRGKLLMGNENVWRPGDIISCLKRLCPRVEMILSKCAQSPTLICNAQSKSGDNVQLFKKTKQKKQ